MREMWELPESRAICNQVLKGVIRILLPAAGCLEAELSLSRPLETPPTSSVTARRHRPPSTP